MGNRLNQSKYNKDAEKLAKFLLGKVICYNDQKYMITVTEAYPHDDENSYVKRKDNGDGKKFLTKENDNDNNKYGEIFILHNMIHVIGSCGADNKYNHVLVRGGIKINSNNELVFEHTMLNLEEGRPYYFCHGIVDKNNKLVCGLGFFETDKIFTIRNNDCIWIESFIDIDDKDIKQGGRINIPNESKNDPNGKRYYFYPKALFIKQETI